MKKSICILLLAWAFIFFALPTHPAFVADQAVTWKVYTPFFPGTWDHRMVKSWVEDVTNMSGGRLNIDFIYQPFGEGTADPFALIQQRTVDAGYAKPGLLVQKYPAASLFFGSPAFFDPLGYFTWMYANGGKELLYETFKNAFMVFPAGMYASNVAAWSNKKIDNLSDLKGLRFGANTPLWAKVLAQAGASPVFPRPFWLQAAITGGILEATDFTTPWSDMYFNVQRVTTYCYFPGIQQVAGFYVIAVDNEKWDSLPADLKEIVKAACDASMARSFTAFLLDDAKAVRVLQEQGKVKVSKFSKEMQQEFLDKFVAVYDAVQDPMFQKVWKSQKNFMKTYVPYMKLQHVDAEVNLK